MDSNEIVVKATTWETLTVRLPDLERATEITIAHAPNVRIGTAAIAMGTHRIPLVLEGGDGTYAVSVSDVTDASLALTVKAIPPVTEEAGVITVTLRGKAKDIAFSLVGKPAFLSQRTKWLAPATLNVDDETEIVLRVRNDGSSDAERLVIDVPTPPNVLVSSDEARVAFQGGVRILRFTQDRFIVGECRDIRMTATALDESRVSWCAAIYGANVENSVVIADSDAVLRTQVALTMTAPATSVELREPFPIHVTLSYRGTPQEKARIRFEGPGISVEPIALGGLQSHEERSIKVLGHITEAKAESWEAPLRAFLETPDTLLANAATKVLGSGSIALSLDVEVADEDASLARAVTLGLRNIGTADIGDVQVYLQRVDGLSPVLDSLVVDGKPRLAVDGAVPIYDGIAIGVIPVDSIAEVSLRLRSAHQQVPELVFVAARNGICLATAVDIQSFSNAAQRTIEDRDTSRAASTQAAPTVAAQRQASGAATAENPEDLVSAEVAAQLLTPPADEATPATEAPVEAEPEVEIVEPGLVALDEAPEDNALFLSDPYGTLARHIMALYGLIPTGYQGNEAAATKFALLKEEIGAIYRREVDAVRDGSFGDIGYEFAPATLGAALADYQRSIGANVVDPTSDRAVMAAIVSLADCDGIASEELASWKEVVASRIIAMRSDADFERPALSSVPASEEYAA